MGYSNGLFELYLILVNNIMLLLFFIFNFAALGRGASFSVNTTSTATVAGSRSLASARFTSIPIGTPADYLAGEYGCPFPPLFYSHKLQGSSVHMVLLKFICKTLLIN